MSDAYVRPSGLRLLVTVTFNSNQLRAHLLPLIALEEVDSITLVADVPPPELPKVRAFVPSRRSRRLLGRAGAKLALLRRLVRREHFDWVIGFNFVPHGFNAVHVARRGGARSMYHMIGGETEWLGGGYYSDNNVLGRLPRPSTTLERALLERIGRATVVATMGERMRQRMIGRGLSPRAVVVIPPATDPRRFRPRPGPKPYDVACVAALLDIKRIDVLIAALARLEPRHPSFRAVVAGDGPLRARLEEQAHRCGVGHIVSFLGHVDDVERVYAEARLYALMSSSEGLPIGMLDAMASGLPVVAPDVGEIGTLVVDGRNGLIYPGGDAEALAECLGRLTSDTALAEVLGDTARSDVTSTHSVDAVAEIYRGILAPARTPYPTFDTTDPPR